MDPAPRRRRSRGRIVLRVFGLLVVVLAIAAWASTDHFRAFGGSPSDATLVRMRTSPLFRGDHFDNREPTGVMGEGGWDATKQWIFGSEQRVPICPLPMAKSTATHLAMPPSSGLRITWLGHSTTLIEIDGQTILTDPQWSERASPTTLMGPKRFHPPPLPLADLPQVDAVVVSHDHYDHLDMATVRALAGRGIPFHVPLGIGAHLETWGVPAAQIIEHDDWQRAELAKGVALVSTPSRHFSGRGVPFRTGSHWTSWAIESPLHRVFFSGDTGLTETFREIATREGPFDVALIEIGQWHPSWGDIHLGPVGALEAFARIGAKKLIPIHWSTFELALHAWSEPAETLTIEAEKRGISPSLLTPMLGDPIEPTTNPATHAWWRALPPIASACP